MEKERTLLARGEETITPQAAKASNFHVPKVNVHQENRQFSTDQLMECQFQMREVAQKLVSTSLFLSRFEVKHQGHNYNTKGYLEHYIKSSTNP